LGKLLNLGLENLEVGFWVEGFACRALDEFGGGIATAVGVDLLTKPLEERLIVSVVDRGREGGKVPLSGLPKLGGGQVAESVRRKVAEASKGPVDVLEATACIVGDF